MYKKFDFHKECKGMHFENISKLFDDRVRAFSRESGFTWRDISVILSLYSCIFDCLTHNTIEAS